ncbi:hypothetical protein GCM10007939_19340 [Amylibacter marinus]|uniref:Glycosyl transferase family 2 n=1 Tax=Amylibacter marinus TaxID=1475483 RepID=A0ABQ5VX70_9RHOB|nr:hypothetical protein [Amylibacter marinus]GLQ35651.1 hypothetical protein GCM10007939_19340 [Amylibacter marinus]
MIRAHMATFPPRHDIMLQAVNSIAPQVDALFLCLNEYAHIPDALKSIPNVHPEIPDHNLLDAGKFMFPPAQDDLVFTLDDDILYPADYVTHSLSQAQEIGLDRNIFGYMANAWVHKKQQNKFGWRTYKFFKPVHKVFEVDIIGTGTALMRGDNMPPLDLMRAGAGFVDLTFANWQKQQQTRMWTLPRGADYLRANLPASLEQTSLFTRVAQNRSPQMMQEIRKIIADSSPNAGRPWRGP